MVCVFLLDIRWYFKSVFSQIHLDKAPNWFGFSLSQYDMTCQPPLKLLYYVNFIQTSSFLTIIYVSSLPRKEKSLSSKLFCLQVSSDFYFEGASPFHILSLGSRRICEIKLRGSMKQTIWRVALIQQTTKCVLSSHSRCGHIVYRT